MCALHYVGVVSRELHARLADNMEDFKKKAVAIYKDIVQLPTVEEARIVHDADNSLNQVELKWRQKDIDRGKSIGYAKSYVVAKKTDKPLELLTEINFQRDTSSMWVNRNINFVCMWSV